MNVWSHGHARMSEIAIEHFFGQLRAQSGNSQLSARAYWQASARTALKVDKDLDREKANERHAKPLTHDELLILNLVG